MPPPACAPHTHLGTPLTHFVAPHGAPPKSILTAAARTAAYGWVSRQANLEWFVGWRYEHRQDIGYTFSKPSSIPYLVRGPLGKSRTIPEPKFILMIFGECPTRLLFYFPLYILELCTKKSIRLRISHGSTKGRGRVAQAWTASVERCVPHDMTFGKRCARHHA